MSPYITTTSFLIYVVCRLIAWQRGRAIRKRHAHIPHTEAAALP